jgi:RNA polymerase sigma-70 factor, ECF subfamily
MSRLNAALRRVLPAAIIPRHSRDTLRGTTVATFSSARQPGPGHPHDHAEAHPPRDWIDRAGVDRTRLSPNARRPVLVTGYPDDHDRELLAGLLRDDVTALDELIRRYWSPLIAYVTRLGGSADGAEDIAQQTFQRLWERRGSWRTTGSVRGLLYRIARNLAVSEHRSQQSRSRADTLAGEATREPATPLDLLENAELHDALAHAMQALPRRRREVFILRCVHDLSYREISEIMGISQQTVANQLSRALTTLRESLRPLLDR